MTKKEKPIYVTSQTFHEAGGVENFGRLKMLGEIFLDEDELRKVREEKSSFKHQDVFMAKSLRSGADYVFNFHYNEGNRSSDMWYSGTAYRKMNFLEKLFSSKI